MFEKRIQTTVSTFAAIAIITTHTFSIPAFAAPSASEPVRSYADEISSRITAATKDLWSSEAAKNEVVREEFSKSVKKSVSDELKRNGVPVAEIQKASAILQKSFIKGTSEEYRVFVRSASSADELRTTYGLFDSITVTPFSQEGATTVYSLAFATDGRLGKLLSDDIAAGVLPDAFPADADLIEPTYVKALVSTGTYLAGESLSNMWGQTKIKAADYQYGLSLQPKVKVGIIDTGIHSGHSDLAANMWKNPNEIVGNGLDDDGNGYADDVYGYNFIANSGNAADDHGHGTHVAGIVGSTVNGTGSFGVDSSASLVALKVLDASGAGSSYDIAEAINYAANNGIPVVNLSLGGDGNPSNDMMCSAITSARSKGTLAIVAAGNENADVIGKIPAGCRDALTVGAVDSYLNKASFSNYGAEVDVSAPGVSIYSTYTNGGYVRMSGTSMAAPFVAGLASAIKAHKPSFGPGEIFSTIKSDATTVSVVSSVNVGRFVQMDGEMSSLSVPNDANWTSGSGTGSGTGTSTPPPAVNVAPTLVASASLVSGNTYKITATGSDSDGTIVHYEYWNGTALLASGSSLTSFQLAVTQNMTVTVRATDNAWATAAASVPLTYVAPVANVAPTVALSVKKGSSYNRLNISASDSDGFIAKIEVYVGGVLNTTVVQNSKTYAGYLDFARGKSYSVKVVSTDDRGATTSKSITVK